MGAISKIRFVPGRANELLILCYEGHKPKYIVNLDRKETAEISAKQVPQSESTELSVDDWLKEQLEKAEKYRQFVAKFK